MSVLKRFVPKHEKVVVLAAPEESLTMSVGKFDAGILKELNSAIMACGRAFTEKYVLDTKRMSRYARPDPKGSSSVGKTSCWMISNYGNNLPVDMNFYVVVVGVLISAAFTPVRGVRLLEWLKTPGDSWDGKPDSSPWQGVKGANATLLTQIGQWIQELASYYSCNEIPFTSAVLSTMNQLCDAVRTFEPIPEVDLIDIGGVAAVMLGSLVREFYAAFQETKSGGTPALTFTQTKEINLYSTETTENVWESFKTWQDGEYAQRLTKEYMDAIRIQLPDDLEVANMQINLKASVYEKIYGFAVENRPVAVAYRHGVLEERYTFLADLKKQLERKLVADAYGYPFVSLPEELELFMCLKVGQPIHVSGDYTKWRDAGERFLTRYQNTIADIVTYVRNFYTVGPDVLLPTTDAKWSEIAGRNVIYRVDFHTPYCDELATFRLRKTITHDVQRLNLVSTTIMDGYVGQTSLREQAPQVGFVSTTGNPVGVSDLPDYFMNFWRHYYKRYEVLVNDTEASEWTIDTYEDAYTIYPSAKARKEFELWDSKDKVRAVEGPLYVERQLGDNPTLLDLYFSYPSSVVANANSEQLRSLYEKRLSQLTTRYSLGTIKYQEYFDIERDLMFSKAFLFGAPGAKFPLLLSRTHRSMSLPTGFNSEKAVFDASKSLRISLPRYLKVSTLVPTRLVPIPTIEKILRRNPQSLTFGSYQQRVSETDFVTSYHTKLSVLDGAVKKSTFFGGAPVDDATLENLGDMMQLDLEVDLNSDVNLRSFSRYAVDNAKSEVSLDMVADLYGLNQIRTDENERYLLVGSDGPEELSTLYAPARYNLTCVDPLVDLLSLIDRSCIAVLSELKPYHSLEMTEEALKALFKKFGQLLPQSVAREAPLSLIGYSTMHVAGELIDAVVAVGKGKKADLRKLCDDIYLLLHGYHFDWAVSNDQSIVLGPDIECVLDKLMAGNLRTPSDLKVLGPQDVSLHLSDAIADVAYWTYLNTLVASRINNCILKEMLHS